MQLPALPVVCPFMSITPRLWHSVATDFRHAPQLYTTFQYPTGLANLMTVANADVHEAARVNADRGTILFFIYVMYMSRWPRTVTCT